MAWHARTAFAVAAAVVFFAFAAVAIGALPEQAQVGCQDPADGAQYVGSVWAGRTCADWYESGNPSVHFVPVTGWSVYGQSLGPASGAHQIIFEAGLAAIAWFVAFGCLSVAVAIPVRSTASRSDTRASEP